ncbi:hypothetical protein U9M48_010427, partial [Paspalum notatum var. saurae]
ASLARGSWLVRRDRRLLDRGYTVHATVKNLQDEGETKHLLAMADGAGTRLRLFQMDLVDPASVRPAIKGARGKELLEPAVKGTLNVLRAAKDCGVGRVVLMSSQAAMVPNPNWPEDKVIDEDCGADVELLKKLQIDAMVQDFRLVLICALSCSFGIAYLKHWQRRPRGTLRLRGGGGGGGVVLNPGMVLGPMLTPSVNVSLQLLLQLLRGESLDHLDNIYVGCVDVRETSQTP